MLLASELMRVFLTLPLFHSVYAAGTCPDSAFAGWGVLFCCGFHLTPATLDHSMSCQLSPARRDLFHVAFLHNAFSGSFKSEYALYHSYPDTCIHLYSEYCKYDAGGAGGRIASSWGRPVSYLMLRVGFLIRKWGISTPD